MLNYRRLRGVLNDWGVKFSERLKSWLRANDFKATGQTIDSIKPEVRKTRGKEEIALQFRAKTNKGRVIPDLINSGQPISASMYPYRPIAKWIKDKGVEVRGKSGKIVDRTDKNINRAAFAIAKSIRRKGTIARQSYMGTNMYQNLFKPDQIAMKAEITQAYKEDVNEYIKKQAAKNKA